MFTQQGCKGDVVVWTYRRRRVNRSSTEPSSPIAPQDLGTRRILGGIDVRKWAKVLVVGALLSAVLGISPVSAQAEVPTCDGLPATHVGTEGDDRIVGSSGNDVIVALGGNDVIFSGDGHDVICAGAGVDLVKAGRGKDRVFGGKQNDRLFGQAGADMLHGGSGRDVIRGGAAADVIYGAGGNDRQLDGQGGFDTVHGGPGTDRCTTTTDDSYDGCEIGQLALPGSPPKIAGPNPDLQPEEPAPSVPIAAPLSSCPRYTPHEAHWFQGFVDNYPNHSVTAVYLYVDPCEAYLIFIDIGPAFCDLAEAYNYHYPTWASAVISIANETGVDIGEVAELAVWSMEPQCPLISELLFSQFV